MPLLCIAGHRHWSEHSGGVELQTRYLGEALRATGWHVAYLCHSLTGKHGSQSEAPGCTIWWIPSYPYGFCVRRREIHKLLADLRPDVIYQRGWGVLQESGVVLEFALRHNIPYVFALSSDGTVRWPFPTARTFALQRYPRWRSWLLLPYALWSDTRLRMTLRRAPYLFAQHSQQQALLARRYGRASLIVPSLHPELHRPVQKHPTPLVVWLHNYRPHAQLDVALRIAAEYERTGVEFHLVTGSTRPEQLRELRRWRRLPSNVRLSGALPAEEAQRLLEQAWVLLHTGLYEGLPNSFIQAWMRETPVVSLWVDPDDVLQREAIGFCAHGDLSALRAALDRFLYDPHWRRAIGLRARAYAERHHGLVHNRARISCLFEGICQRKQVEELAECLR